MTQNPFEKLSPSDQDAVFELADKLFDAAREGQREVLAAYIQAGAPVDLKNATGDTMLMLAAYHGHAAAVQALLRLGADPDAVNDRNQSPLAGAVFKGYEDVVGVLLEAGADPNAGAPSALQTAQYFEKPDLEQKMQQALESR